jgi:hypothetical protein
MDPAEQSLFSFEHRADQEIASSQVWKLPLRSVLSALFLTADGLINRGDTERGASLVSRISFLCPFLKNCSLDIGASAEDGLSIIGKYELEILRQAAMYASFCEVMPEVRHGHVNVKSVKRGFRLTYKEPAYQTAEEHDFVLHEIGKATDASSLEMRSALFSHLVQEWPMWDLRMVNSAFDQLYTHHLRSVHESPLLHLDAYSTAFGFTREEFASVRAALFALASFSNGMHLAAAEERDRSGDPGTIARYQAEFLEWNTPILTKEFVYSCLTRATGLSGSRIEDVLSFLVLNAVTGDFDNAGDGYLPPLVLFEDSILFNPHAVRIMTHERNLLYVLNKRQRDHFNNIVSQHLEPMLLNDALAEFSRVPDWLVERNVRWSRGEVDLLVFDPTSNTVLQIQAKAAIPAQNARMTRQLEDHTLRAITQIKRLKGLDSTERDRLCSRAFRRQIVNSTLISAILSRSGLGTWRSWSALGDVVPLNIPLLREALRVISLETGSPLTMFPRTAANLLNTWARRVVRGWQQPKIELLGKLIHFPRINTDNRELSNLKVELGLVP